MYKGCKIRVQNIKQITLKVQFLNVRDDKCSQRKCNHLRANNVNTLEHIDKRAVRKLKILTMAQKREPILLKEECARI